MRIRLRYLAAVFGLIGVVTGAEGAEVKILTAGAMKEVVLAIVPALEKETGHKAVVANDTAGGLVRRIGGGEAFDLAIITPGAINELTSKGKIVAGSRVNLARVGVGVVVKDDTPLPDISNVEAFKRALLAAKSVAYIDPASGGSSGIYVSGLLDKLGIAAEVKPKARLKQGGYVAELIASGEAELGLHQISEIIPVKGVKLVGPLPAEIQNFTTYAAAVGAEAKEPDAARAMLKLLAGPAAEDVLKARGMERPPS
jgi:molybdate transport system substrate-binding protein